MPPPGHQREADDLASGGNQQEVEGAEWCRVDAVLQASLCVEEWLRRVDDAVRRAAGA